MEISGDSDSDAEAGPSKKRVRSEMVESAADDDQAKFAAQPKWSNPDPYTALPCDGASSAKKKDIVQTIRKARVDTKDTKSTVPTEAAPDVIYFDDSDNEDEVPVTTHFSGQTVIAQATDDGPGEFEKRMVELAASSAQVIAAPGPFPPPPFPIPNTHLGSRKRTHNDRIKPTSSQPGGPRPTGDILDAWKPRGNPTPWLRQHDSPVASRLSMYECPISQTPFREDRDPDRVPLEIGHR